MKKTLQIIGSITLLFLGSCTTEFLKEIHPTKKTADTFFTNDADAKEAAIGLYDYMTKLYGANADAFLPSFDMLRGDNLVVPKNFGNNGLSTFLTLNYNPETKVASDGWQFSYETIYRANWIIENVIDNTAISAETKKSVLAEAYFMRGFCYFVLTHLYEEVPLVLKVTTPESYYPEKATNEECWNQVVKDLEESLKGLPAPKPNFVDGRANTGVANALLARTYLYRTRPGNKQHWDKVKQYATAVESLGVYALEPMQEDKFRDIFVYTKGDKWVKNQEMIWGAGFVYGPIYGGLPFMYRNLSTLGSIGVMPVGMGPIQVVNENGVGYLPGNGRTGQARYAASPELSDIMIQYGGKGDKRTKEFLFYPKFNNYVLKNTADPTSVIVKSVVNTDSLYQKIKQTNGTAGEYLHIKKYAIKEFIGTNIWDGGYNHPLMYPVIRYADLVLMRAEAEFQLGNMGVAKEYLKKITDRAGFAPTYTDGFSGQALLDEILQQRRVELFFESQRVPDLIRLDKFKPPFIGTATGSVPFEEKLRVVPIPRRELDNNPNLVQNPLWR